MNTMTQLRTKNVGKNVKLVSMIFNGISILNFAMESSKKMDMFMKGYRTAQCEEEREILSVKGWTWVATPLDVEIGTEATLPHRDGWDDWDWVEDEMSMKKDKCD